MKLNVPNLVTISRAVLAPLFFFLFLAEEPIAVALSLPVFVLAALTDYWDGWFARRYKEATDFGRVIDPLADKVLITAAFIAFAFERYAPWWMVTVVIIRDAATTYLRSYADALRKPMKTSFSAKSKTFAQMAYVIIILLLVCASKLRLEQTWSGARAAIEVGLHPDVLYYGMLAVTLFTVWTGIEYFASNRHITCRLVLKVLRMFGKSGKGGVL